tara:strand:+ start:26 stop:298 length:273 start_codon:yes stop_codon:yes gene_type:complete
MERTLTKGIFMVNEVLMVVKITIAMLGGATFPVDIEMITTQEHCEQEIKNFNPIKLNFVGNIINVQAQCLPLTEQDKNDIIIETEEGVTL